MIEFLCEKVSSDLGYGFKNIFKTFLLRLDKMKLLLTYLFLIILSLPTHSGSYGSGKIKLSPEMADYFVEYLKHQNYPDTFVITNNGFSWAWYWTCPEGLNSCRPSADSKDVKFCEIKSKKKCSIFAKLKKIVWNNGINLGDKNSRFKSSWSEKKIKAKLTQLGFFD